MAIGFMSADRSADAQRYTLRLPPRVTFEVSVKNPHGQRVFKIDGAPTTNPAIVPVTLGGSVRFSPKLCNGTYGLTFAYITNRGRRTPFFYTVRVRRGRLDGIATKCPFAGLPHRGFQSMHVNATIEGERLLSLDARSTKSGNPFARLKVPDLKFHRTQPEGVVGVRIRVRYRHQRSHIIKFVANLSAKPASA
jgi:hypothetical protein